mgnify:CR=1 FL=1
MKNHLEIIREIDQLLTDQNMETERKQLENEVKASATGSEICSRYGSKLLALQNKNKDFDLVAGHLITEFISYCHAVGIRPL